MATEIKRCCELCTGEATVFCESDSAYLCRKCDADVHDANFLVARHVRRTIICFKHSNNDSIKTTTDIGEDKYNDLDAISSLSSASSVSISTGESTTSNPKSTSSVPLNDDEEISSSRSSATRRRAPASVDSKIEGVLENWCMRLGQDCNFVVPVAVSVLRGAARGRRLPGAPFRVVLAASFWVGVRMCGGDTWRDVRRVEEVTRVPAKVVVAAAARIAPPAAKRRKVVDDRAEGWAEC